MPDAGDRVNAPTRPVLRWHGSKWRLAYVEPFGAAASVLLRKERVAAEIWNDLDQCIVNLFRVLQDPTSAAHLTELLRLTPFAREEFKLSNRPCDGRGVGTPLFAYAAP